MHLNGAGQAVSRTPAPIRFSKMVKTTIQQGCKVVSTWRVRVVREGDNGPRTPLVVFCTILLHVSTYEHFDELRDRV